MSSLDPLLMVLEFHSFQAKLNPIVVSREKIRSSGFSEAGNSVGPGRLPFGAVLDVADHIIYVAIEENLTSDCLLS